MAILRNTNVIDKYYPIPEPAVPPAAANNTTVITPAPPTVTTKPKVTKPVITKAGADVPTMWNKAKVVNPLQTIVEQQVSTNPNLAGVVLQKEREPLANLEQISGYSAPSAINMDKLNNKDGVKLVQNILLDAGKDLGKYGADGIVGKFTKAAIDSYNKDIQAKSAVSFTPNERQNPTKHRGTDVTAWVPETQCAQYVANELHRISNTTIPITEFLEKTGLGTDAWRASDAITKAGGQYIYNERDDVDRGATKKKVGDVVSLFTGGRSDYQAKADAYNGGKPNSAYTHLGFISKVYPDGSYDIDNNVHKREGIPRQYVGHASITHVDILRDKSGKPIVDANGNTRASNRADSGNRVGQIVRPNYDAMMGKNTVFNPDINLASNDPKNVTEGSIVNFYNKNKQTFANKFKLDEDENISIAKAALGILNQESNMGEEPGKLKVKEVLAETKKRIEGALNLEVSKKGVSYVPGLEYGKNTEASKGLGRIKYKMNFDDKELGYLKDAFGIEDEASPEGSFVFTAALLSKSYLGFLRKGHTKEEALYRAIAQHNSPSKAKSIGSFSADKGKDYAKDYNIDYVNKVLDYSTNYPVLNKGKRVGAITDKLATNKAIISNTAKVPSVKSKLLAGSSKGLLKKA